MGEHLVWTLCIQARTSILEGASPLTPKRQCGYTAIESLHELERLLTRMCDNFFGDFAQHDQHYQHAKLPRQEVTTSVLR